MESNVGIPADAPEMQPARPVRSRTRTGRLRLPQRSQLDGRTAAAKAFDQLVTDIEADLGGHDQLSAIERSLIEGFAGASVTLRSINASMCLGQEIDITELAQTISSLARISTRLGEHKRLRLVNGAERDHAPSSARSARG